MGISTPNLHLSWIALLSLSASLACGDASEAGAGPSAWTVAGEPLLRIGAQEGDPGYLFDGVATVRMLPDGGLLVGDQGSGSLRVYDANGRLSASMGRRGEGPGEFSWLAYAEMLPPDTILAYDGRLYRTTRFLLDGTPIDDRRVSAEGGSPELYVGTFTDGDAAIASLVPSPRGGTEILADRMAVARYGPDGTRVAELGTVPGIRRAGGVAAVPFSPFLHAFVLRDSVFYTDGMEAALHVLGNAGRPARTVTVPIEAPDLDTSWSILRRELEVLDQSAWITDLSPEVEAQPVPSVGEVMLDGEERFWLKHFDPATDATHLRGERVGGGRWTVVEPNGRVVATVDLPTGFAPMDAADMRLAGVQRDALGVERVVVLALTR